MSDTFLEIRPVTIMDGNLRGTRMIKRLSLKQAVMLMMIPAHF